MICCQRLFFDFFYLLCRLLRRHLHIKTDISRITHPKRILRSQIHTDSCRNQNQHPGRQYADACQSRRILLHPVHHAGNRDKMVRLIIKFLLPAHKLEDGDASGRKQKIGCDNNQNYRQEKQRQRIHRIFYRSRHIITDSQKYKSRNGHDPFRLWLLLSDISAF